MDDKTYTIGIKINDADHYDRLMEKHSKDGMFGLNFKEFFDGYPEGYPCLVEYTVGANPMGFVFSTQLRELIEDGYLIQLKTE